MYYLAVQQSEVQQITQSKYLSLRLLLVFGLFDAAVIEAHEADCGKENNRKSLVISKVNWVTQNNLKFAVTAIRFED